MVLDQREPPGRLIDQIEPAEDRGAVAVDADDAGARDVQDHPAIAAGPEGRVNIDAAVARVQQRHGLVAKDRNVS